MNILERSESVPEAERAFGQALEFYGRLRELDVRSTDYVEAIVGVIGSCQNAISFDGQHGDAHVLLANAFYLQHLRIQPMTGNELPLKLAAATIQHWSDQPMSQPPLTMNVDKGCRIYEMIASALSELRPDCAGCEESEMRFLATELYSQALVADACEWTAV